MNRTSSLLVATTLFLLPTLPSTAFAHAHLLSSTPTKNSVIHKVPSEVVLHFSEELELAMCKLDVKNLKTGKIISQGKLSNDGSDTSSLKISLDTVNAKNGEYEVSWRAVSKDTHRMPGHYKFTVEAKSK